MFAETMNTSSQGNFWVGLLTIAIIVGLIVLWVRHSHKKTRSKYWSGKVIDKKQYTSTDEDGDRSTSYELVVAVDGATKPKKVGVNAGLFNTFSIGDKIEKKLGELHPSKMA